jgi:hypothetical protein
MVKYEIKAAEGQTLTVYKSCDCHYMISVNNTPLKYEIPVFELISQLKHFGVEFEQIPVDLLYWFPGYDREKNLLNITQS